MSEQAVTSACASSMHVARLTFCARVYRSGSGIEVNGDLDADLGRDRGERRASVHIWVGDRGER